MESTGSTLHMATTRTVVKLRLLRHLPTMAIMATTETTGPIQQVRPVLLSTLQRVGTAPTVTMARTHVQWKRHGIGEMPDLSPPQLLPTTETMETMAITEIMVAIQKALQALQSTHQLEDMASTAITALTHAKRKRNLWLKSETPCRNLTLNQNQSQRQRQDIQSMATMGTTADMETMVLILVLWRRLDELTSGSD